jgi:hypothetical protein
MVQTRPRVIYFKSDKSRQDVFGREVNPSALCEILRRVKDSYEYERYFEGKIYHFLRRVLLPRYQMTAVRITRGLWWANQQFCPVDSIPPWFSMLISYRPVGGCTSETWSHQMDMVIIMSVRKLIIHINQYDLSSVCKKVTLTFVLNS